MEPVPARRSTSTRLIGGLLGFALLVTACGDDPDDDEARVTTTTAPAAPDAPASADADATASDDTEPTATPDADVEAGTSVADGNGEEAATGASNAAPPTPGPPANMTSGDVCARLPGRTVARALGVDQITVEAGTAATPQCAYFFQGDDGVHHEVTVAVLRVQEDLAGRQGREAFDYVVGTNKAVAQHTEVTDAPIDVGDQAVLLTGGNLRMGIVQLGNRIVTTLMGTAAADTDASESLSRATEVFQP